MGESAYDQARVDYRAYLEQLKALNQQYKEVTGELKTIVQEEGLPVWNENAGALFDILLKCYGDKSNYKPGLPSRLNLAVHLWLTVAGSYPRGGVHGLGSDFRYTDAARHARSTGTPPQAGLVRDGLDGADARGRDDRYRRDGA